MVAAASSPGTASDNMLANSLRKAVSHALPLGLAFVLGMVASGGLSRPSDYTEIQYSPAPFAHAVDADFAEALGLDDRMRRLAGSADDDAAACADDAHRRRLAGGGLLSRVARRLGGDATATETECGCRRRLAGGASTEEICTVDDAAHRMRRRLAGGADESACEADAGGHRRRRLGDGEDGSYGAADEDAADDTTCSCCTTGQTGFARLFGQAHLISATLRDQCMLIVIGIVIVIEVGTHHLEHFFHGTTYLIMIEKVYKELMVIGIISITLFITIQSGSLTDHTQIEAFEYTHFLLTFTALFLIAQAFVLMRMCSLSKRAYDTSATVGTVELRRQYELVKNKWYFKSPIPLSWVRFCLTIKMMNFFFVKQYNVSKAFDFATYMRMSLDEHVIELMDVDWRSWVALAVFVGINMVRDSVAGESELDADNMGEDGPIFFFICFGFFLLGIATLLMASANVALNRLLKKAGCPSTDKLMETVESFDRVLSRGGSERLGAAELAEALVELSPPGHLHRTASSLGSGRSQMMSVGIDAPSGDAADADDGISSRKLNKKKKSTTGLQLAVDLSDVYLFKSPLLFFRTLDALLLFNCLYLAMLVANFLQSVLASGSWSYLVMSLIPPLMWNPMLVSAVSIHSGILALTKINPDIVGHVLEEALEEEAIRDQVLVKFKKAVLDKASDDGVDKHHLGDLFKELDTDSSGTIDYTEFRVALKKLNIHCSKRKYDRLFAAIDYGGDGKIDEHEFTWAVMPELVDEADKPTAHQLNATRNQGRPGSPRSRH